MAEFAGMLGSQLDRPVFDVTGLAGEYEINLYWINEERLPAPAEDPYAGLNGGPTIFTALRDQLGLKLENRKQAVEMLVIDYALRVPTEN